MAKHSVMLDANLDISHVLAQQETLNNALNETDELYLNGSAVVKADTAGLQLLLSVVKEAERRGGKIHWESPSSELLDAAQMLGVQRALALEIN